MVKLELKCNYLFIKINKILIRYIIIIIDCCLLYVEYIFNINLYII